MTKPANLFAGKEKISIAMKQQSWVLFLVVIIIVLLDSFVFHSELVIAKSFVVGALLSFITQYVVAYLVFRRVGYQARHKIVNSMYLSAIIKWITTIIGFIIIFTSLKPINTGSVIVGYIILQVLHIIQIFKTA